MADIRQKLEAREGFALATINLDHIVKMNASPAFTEAYAAQDLVIADGWPIVTLSRIARQPVDLMPGSELIVPLCKLAAETRRTVAFVGSTDNTLSKAAQTLMADIPGLTVAYTHAPPMGFDPQGEAAAQICADLKAQGIGLCFLALGAPKQETFAARARGLAPETGFASIGAGLDFIAGQQRRAPLWVRKLKMEWLWRALSSPLRLGPRYVKCLAVLPGRMLEARRNRA
ncbi:WecB/TagA/CpsF family glycosyltransferase [Roseovarius sp. A21]|uniref:WecB/TagA/CpsF family glycosyltransferase n=2 Tax=Roseovarius bejariae TaxID=2576383 RepID=A0A844CNB1_9RHOB|nr:WecB/TagA/CpsF family glycosyltransferase [Roseovarius bejariae]MRU16092.1 WecB/TagA/CpsF family glycosyltransferase [Roseovarius bejariae]